MPPERSRSRDTRVPPRGLRTPRWPQQPPPRRPWQPSQPRRRVLLLVDLEPTRELLTELDNDAMEVTTRAFDQNIRLSEQQALFTYSRLLTPRQVSLTTVEDLLHGIINYMFSTWGVALSIDSIDLRWTDSGGDVFAPRNPQTIGYLLGVHRPHWN